MPGGFENPLTAMLRCAVLTLFIIAAAPQSARTQEFPRWELFGGVSYAHVDLGPEAVILQPTDKNHFGMDINGSFNPRRYLRIILCDFSVQLGGTKVILTPEHGDVRTSQVLFGPELVRRSGAAAPFVHALIGVTNARLVSSIGGSDITPDLVNHTSLALGLGGGFDIQWHRRFALRVVQADYVPTRISGSWENHYRLSSGIVWTFGQGHGRTLP